MGSNLDEYKRDLERLQKRGQMLWDDLVNEKVEGGVNIASCRTSAIMGHIWEVENPRV